MRLHLCLVALLFEQLNRADSDLFQAQDDFLG